MFFDPVYMLFMVPGLLLSFWASYRTKSTFRKYAEVPAKSGMSGAEAARQLLQNANIPHVKVEQVAGFLSDHYDPSAKVLRLSPDVYAGRSLSALGVAAHEAGHAIQDAVDYAPLKFRSLVVKPASIGSQFGIYILIGGFFLNSMSLVYLGIAAFSLFVVFTLITLPVEFNASSRAVAVLEQSGIITRSEVDGTKAVLNAAAMTYVAAAIGAVMQLIYFLMRAGLLGGNRDD